MSDSPKMSPKPSTSQRMKKRLSIFRRTPDKKSKPLELRIERTDSGAEWERNRRQSVAGRKLQLNDDGQVIRGQRSQSFRGDLRPNGKADDWSPYGSPAQSGRAARPGADTVNNKDPRSMTLPSQVSATSSKRVKQVVSPVKRLALANGMQNNEREREALMLSPRGNSSAPAPLPEGVLFQVRVLFDFDAQDTNEVSVKEGDICDVAYDVMREHGWFEVVTKQQERGLIPVSFCEVIESTVPSQPSLEDVDFDTAPGTSSRSSSPNGTKDDEEVRHYLEARDSVTIEAPLVYDGNADYVYDSPPTGDSPQPHEPVNASTSVSEAELSPRSSKRRKRSHVVREILETEQAYVQDLAFICSHFVRPIEKQQLLKPMESNTIFRNITSISELHKELVASMEEAVEVGIDQGGMFPAANCELADVFLTRAAFLKLYTLYCVHQEHGRELLLSKIGNNRQFSSFLLEMQKVPASRNLSLETFLMAPVQRICKYPLLVKELIKCTEDTHPDYKKLCKLHEVLENVAQHLNEQKSIAFSIRRMAHLDKNMTHRPTKFQLALPTRRLMLEGDLLRIGGGQRQLRRVFLFNDILIWAKSKGDADKGKDKYKFRGMVQLSTGTTFVEPISRKIESNAFQIIKPECTTANIFAATSLQLRTKWLTTMAKIIGGDHVRMEETTSTVTRSLSASRSLTATPPSASQSSPALLANHGAAPSSSSPVNRSLSSSPMHHQLTKNASTDSVQSVGSLHNGHALTHSNPGSIAHTSTTSSTANDSNNGSAGSVELQPPPPAYDPPDDDDIDPMAELARLAQGD